MDRSLSRHQREVLQNRLAWERKPLLRELYAGFYQRILQWIDRERPGRIVEIGSGMGNFQEHCPAVLRTDLFADPWVDQVCDAYELPFGENSVSHLVLCDVFHHLERPLAFLRSAERCVAPRGRIVLFEPYISVSSLPVYGLFHHEPAAWRKPIDLSETPPPRQEYYAAQGNATRLFFLDGGKEFTAWRRLHTEAFASFSYLLSGGFSKPSLYPKGLLGTLRGMDRYLSRWPRVFAARCLVVLERLPPTGL
jgi:hypothetical protein